MQHVADAQQTYLVNDTQVQCDRMDVQSSRQATDSTYTCKSYGPYYASVADSLPSSWMSHLVVNLSTQKLLSFKFLVLQS